MDVQFINPVLNAIKNTLQQMASLNNMSIGKPQVIRNYQVACGIVTGIMTMSSEKSHASIALTFSESAILSIASKLLPENHNSVNGIVGDLVGELANIVMGDAKRQLEEKDLIFQMSLPIIIIGREHLIAHKANAPVIRVPFSTQAGEFCVEAVYEKLN
jgi:chemotaxis protein CheX